MTSRILHRVRPAVRSHAARPAPPSGRRHLALLPLLVACALPIPTTPAARQPAPAVAEDSTEVARTVHAFHRALARGDSAAVLALLAPDAVVLESGVLETRDEYRAHHLEADIRFARAVSAERGPVRVTVVGDVAWAASVARRSGRYGDREIEAEGAELMVLSREGAGWRIRAVHWSSRTRR